MAESSVSMSSTHYARKFLSTNSEEKIRLSGVDSLGGDFSRLSVAASTAAEYVPKYEERSNKFFENAKFPKYYSESARMATFSNWHFKQQSPKVLTGAGFFSTGEDDEVYCFYCGGRLYDWTSDVLPWEEHALYFPRCEWLLQRKGKDFVEQIQSNQTDLSKEKEKQPLKPNLSNCVMTASFYNEIDMSILENRIRSFEGHHLLLRFTVTEFAAAGFFYVLIYNIIKCYMCHIEVHDWRDGCSPFEMHQKISPTCEVVTRFKSADDKETEGFYKSKEQNLYSQVKHENDDGIPNRNDYVLSTEDYRREYDRLLSFYHWPICPVVDRHDLAAAGFYWKDKLISITVQCFACFGIVNEWKMGERPEVKHKSLYPCCPFLRGMETGNIKITQEEKIFTFRIFSERDALKNRGKSYYVSSQTSLYKSSSKDSKDLKFESLEDPLYKLAKYPHFYFEIERLKSFSSWSSHHCITLTTLADAGFFNNNIKDQVICFFCDGKLYQWEASDDPWEEHARNFPHCKWLLEQKGKQFVDNVQTKYETSVSQTAQQSTGAPSARRKLGRGEVLPLKKHSQRKHQTVQPDHDLGTLLKSDVVQVLVEMGFDMNIIRTVIQKRLHQGLRPYQDAEDLLSAIFEEDESCKTSDGSETNHMASDPGNPPQNQPEAQHHQDDVRSSRKETATEDTQNELVLLSQKLERLEEKNLCKICLDGEVNVLFLPCKHLVVCKNCSEKLDECPICRTYIDDKVPVFMP